MNEKLFFYLYELKNKGRIRYNYRMNQVTNTFLRKPYRHEYRKYSGQNVLGELDANILISSYIESGKPFWVGRYGHTEFALLISSLRSKFFGKEDELERAFFDLCNNAGFFPMDITLVDKYVDLIIECCQGLDAHAMWPLKMEDYFIARYEENVKLFKYVYLEPWAMTDTESGVLPWSHSLKGKKVLIVHPFTETIKSQYENKREQIFQNVYLSADDILPQFELRTLKAVQTLAGNRDERFATWFEALEWMKQECKNIDFDVAILGCGAYGFPLAAEIKKMGKGAIQICGATQLMFGILGKRWDNNAFVQRMVNDAWVRPDEKEGVNNSEAVENSCYW